MSKLKRLLRRVKRLRQQFNDKHVAIDYTCYAKNPLGYFNDVLGVQLTPQMTNAVTAMMNPPQRVLCSSGHSVGKTFLAGCLVNWWYDSHPNGLCLTTAPTDRQVKDLLWKEVRSLRSKTALPQQFVGPKIPRLESSPTHFAHGYTAADATKFQGHHSPGGVLIIFDEAEGIDPSFWEAMKTMLDDNSYFIAFYNPTSIGSGPHLKEEEAEIHGTYVHINLSCLDHPNIANQLKGYPLAINGAITLKQLESMLLEDSMLLTPAEELQPGDIELNGKRYRVGPIAQARCLGIRPSSATCGIWSEDLWNKLLQVRLDIQTHWPVVIGCDVARYGDDSTAIWVRKGLCVLHCETHRMLNTKQVSERLKQLCNQFKDVHNEEKRIPCMVDEGGIGGGVIDQCDDYLFVAVNAACKPRRDDRYTNVRSELWFTAREPALQGLLDVSRIPPIHLQRFKTELMVAKYEVLPRNGKIAVSSKAAMKSLLKRSPDLADSFNLTLYPPTPAG